MSTFGLTGSEYLGLLLGLGEALARLSLCLERRPLLCELRLLLGVHCLLSMRVVWLLDALLDLDLRVLLDLGAGMSAWTPDLTLYLG